MNLIIEIGLGIVAFYALAFWLKSKLRIPPGIDKKYPDGLEKDNQFWYHTTSFISIFHAIVVLLVSTYLLATNGINYTSPNYPAENHLFAFSTSYFLFDFIFGLWKKYNDLPMNIHHVCVLSSLFYALIKNVYGDNLLWAMIITEVSNPLLLASNICGKEPKYEKYAFPLSVAFAITFLIFRIFIAGLFMQAMNMQEVSFYIKFSAATLC